MSERPLQILREPGHHSGLSASRCVGKHEAALAPTAVKASPGWFGCKKPGELSVPIRNRGGSSDVVDNKAVLAKESHDG